MEFEKFIITNFKGIKNAEFDLGTTGLSQICTLIGLNESGKTTLLEAIHTFYTRFIPSKFRDLTVVGEVDVDPCDFIPRSELANFNDSCKISAIISCTKYDFREFIEKSLVEGFNIEMPDKFKIEAQVEFKYESSEAKYCKNYFIFDCIRYKRRVKEYGKI